MHQQTKSPAAASPRRRQRCQEFIAAVRYLNGRRELVAVKNVRDAADARELVLSELIDVTAVVVAPRH